MNSNFKLIRLTSASTLVAESLKLKSVTSNKLDLSAYLAIHRVSGTERDAIDEKTQYREETSLLKSLSSLPPAR